MKRVGCLRPRVTVRAEGSDVDELVYQPAWSGGGELVFASGRRFTLAKASFWRQEWMFTGPGGTEIVRFHRGMTMSKARVNCSAAGAGIPELPMLLLVGWYLLLLMADDDAAIAAC